VRLRVARARCTTFNPLVALSGTPRKTKRHFNCLGLLCGGLLEAFSISEALGRRHPHHRQHDSVSEAPNVGDRPGEPRQTVRLGANWCKTLQVVAGACFRLIARP